MDEVELKLDLTPEAADALEASACLPGRPEIATQRSIYFDTPDHALRKAGLSLRIRRSGRKRVQTVKSHGTTAAGLFQRPELERPVRNDSPMLDGTPIRAVLGDTADAIGAVFEVRIERRTWIISEGGATIELVLDRGVAVAGERMSPICEIELELKAGRPAALFALARRIDTITPTRLGVQTKAERGYRLAGSAATMIRAERVALEPSMTAAAAFQQIVQSCVRQFRLNEALLLDGGNAEALHQARVGVRRLRSAFSIFKPVTGGASQAKLREELRWLAAELGEARNLDVLLERVGPGALHDRIAAARAGAYESVGRVLASSRVRALMLELVEWSSIGDWLGAPKGEAGQSARMFAITALNRFRHKMKRDGRRLAKTDDQHRHEVRKDAKKLRYASEFFTSLFEGKRERRRYRKFVAALEAVQDRLGALNDLATAPQVLAALGVADDPEAAPLLAGGKRKSLLRSAAEAHEDFIDSKPFWR